MFSVLLSVYSGEKAEFLTAAFNSIVNQTISPDEIVIVKDGELGSELDKLIDDFVENNRLVTKIISIPANVGLGRALQQGVLACTMPYIARMDTDDIADSTRFEKQMEFLKQCPEIDLLGSWISEFSNDMATPDRIMKLPLNDGDIRLYAKKRNPFAHMSVVFKKEAVITSGNYQDFRWFEDYHLWVRMLQKGCRVANLPETLVNVRVCQGFYERRSGLEYIKKEFHFQLYLYRSRFINMNIFLSNVLTRLMVRCLPLIMKRWFYAKCLRSKNE